MRRYASNQNIQKNYPIPQNKKTLPQTISPKISRNHDAISPRYSRNTSIAETIRSRNLQKQQIATSNLTFLQKNPQKRLLPLIIRRIFKCFLKKDFVSLKEFKKIKKFSLYLLQQKQSRHLNDGFLCLKYHYFENKMQQITNFNQKSKNPSFLCIILKKYLNKILAQSFKNIKKKSQIKTKVICFINKVDVWHSNTIQNNFLNSCFSKLRQFYELKNVRNKGFQRLNLLQKRLKIKLLSKSFMKILNFSFVILYEKNRLQKAEKNTDNLSISQSPKATVAQQRNNLKKRKGIFDTINLQKNRSLNQLKNARQLRKQSNAVEIRILLQQKISIQEQLHVMLNNLKQLQMQFQNRQKRKLNASNQKFMEKVCEFYKSIKNSKQWNIDITQHFLIKKILEGNQIIEFKQKSPEYLYQENLHLLRLVSLYENVNNDSKNEIDPDYQRKIEENKALKDLLANLIERDILNFIKKPQNKTKKDHQKIQNQNNRSRGLSSEVKQITRQVMISDKPQQTKKKSKSLSKQKSNQKKPEIKNLLKTQQNVLNSPRNYGKIISRATYSNKL